MLTATFFLVVTAVGTVLALMRGPFWALLVYANVYFNSPHPGVNWWAASLPDVRWSLFAFAVLGLSMVLHRDRLATHENSTLKWIFAFLVLTLITSHANPADIETAREYSYMLFTFFLIGYALVKTLADLDQLKFFLLLVIAFATNLSIKAVTEGKRIHARLENIGTADALGSNEFGLLLVAIIPLLIPFLFHGKLWERICCLLALPLLINAVILTSSRTAIVALVGAALFCALFLADVKVKKYFVIFTVLVVPAFISLADEYFIERMSTLFVSDQVSQEQLDEISSGRLAIWGHGLEMSADYPLGAGPGGFRAMSRFYMPEEILVYKPGRTYGARAAHSSYLLVLVEQGWVGLLLYLTLCFSALWMLIRNIVLYKRKERLHTFSGFLLMGLCFSLLTVLIGSHFTSRVYYEFFWWQIALSVIGSSLAARWLEENLDIAG